MAISKVTERGLNIDNLSVSGNVSVSGTFSANGESKFISVANTNLLVNDRLQVANAEALYVSLSGDTMSGDLQNLSSTNSPLNISSSAANGSATLDASGNFLVGTTQPLTDAVVQAGGVGIDLRGASDLVKISRANDIGLFLNRNSSDGEILQFQKNGSGVGSIGVDSSTRLFFTNSSGAGLFLSSGTQVEPMNNGSRADDTMNLGGATYRFKDAYLSGGVYLGGTGSANYFDDYEEGTWTAQCGDSADNLSPTTATCRYTKIGNTVHLILNIDNVSTSGLTAGERFEITGLPFTPREDSRFSTNAVRSSSVSVDNGPLVAQIWHVASAPLQFLDSNGQGFLIVSELTSGSADFRFSITYFTDA